MSVSASNIASDMIKAARTSFGGDWKAARKYAEVELKHLARILVEITKSTAKGDISKAEAKTLLRIHRNTTEMVLITAKGLGIIAVERAVNAALKVVKDAVNSAAGFAIL